MDELWQRYRTFWTPVLIGLGAFLVGLIAVHIASDDPKVAKGRLVKQQSKVRNLKQPERNKAQILETRGEELRAKAEEWAARIDQCGGKPGEETLVAMKQALRAAVLRGAPQEEASNANLLKARFDDHAVAADKAYKRFEKLVALHTEGLRTGDPNVAGSRLLSDVWNEMRVRANRGDVEIGPAARQLGFGGIGSVSRATLPARVLNLALVARIVDTAIRNHVELIDQISIPNQIDPGSPQDFLRLWPVTIVMIGDMSSIKHVIDLVTDPAHPVPIDSASLMEPKQSRGKAHLGHVQLSMKVSSALVRADVDLQLDQEEDQ